MSTQRIVMPHGHVELSIGGVNYRIDDTGAFEVPAEAVAELKAVHGATIEPGLNQLEANLHMIDASVTEAKQILEMRLEAQLATRKALDTFKAQQKVRDDEKLRAFAAQKAADEKKQKEIADALAAATAKPTAAASQGARK